MNKAIKNTFYATIFVPALFAGMYAHAGHDDLIGKNIEVRPAKNACMAEAHRAFNMHMTRGDMDRMELANAFQYYLEAQGQDSAVVRSLYRASAKTGVDFELLLLKATMESDLGRFSTAAHSSARGVFQYIEPTWLVLMNRYGAKIGYPEYAGAIKISKHKQPYFSGNDAYLKTEILALRYDADVSALIKAYQILEETEVIQSHKRSKNVSAADHYLTHMLGLPLAEELYSLMNRNSVFAVARLDKPEMREAARLNKQFFYDSSRRPMTAKGVYNKIEQRVAYEMDKIRKVEKLSGQPDCQMAAQIPDLKTIR